MERWKKIDGYDNYSVSDMGRVRNDKKNIILKNVKILGYVTVNLCKNGVAKKLKVHRLVAEAFIPNPNNYPIINHKNEIKDDNRVENLEWCTIKYNTNYGSAPRKIALSKMKPVMIDNIRFESVAAAAKHMRWSRTSIYSRLLNNIYEYQGHTICYC